jgi:SAM-dependent methyltransferase
MILHRLLWRFARHRDDAEFYRLQAVDAIRWIRSRGVPLTPGFTALDLGCGHGVFGRELAALGGHVTYADERSYLPPDLAGATFLPINLDREPLDRLGRHDLVICSNVLEHLGRPEAFLSQVHALLKPSGCLYLSWTNWLSPWGGHEFSPLHYLGPRLGPALYDRLSRRPRFHQPQVNLFPTYIGHILRHIERQTALTVVARAPRYYTEFPFLLAVPGLREFVTWNCALLLRPKTAPSVQARIR